MKEHFTVQDLLPLAAAGALDPPEVKRVEAHLHECATCRAEFDEWVRLAGALKELPTPQAPPRLLFQTQRLLSQAAYVRRHQTSRLGLALLVAFSWMVAFVTLGFIRLLDMPLARWLDISSTTVWVAYIALTWLATAVAAGLLGKRWQEEGKTI